VLGLSGCHVFRKRESLLSSTAPDGPFDSDEIIVQRLLEVVNEGRRVATYKLALLLALLDWVMTNSPGDEIPTSDLAKIVFHLYFRQVDEFPRENEGLVTLRQSSQSKKSIIDSVRDFRATNPNVRRANLARFADPEGYERSIVKIEATLVNQPIPRLQTVGKVQIPFLYDWTWPPEKFPKALLEKGVARLTLHRGIRHRLVTLGPLVRPFIEQAWVSDVARWSRIDTEQERLRAHLFGADRTPFPVALRNELSAIQQGRCFYCAKPLVPGFPIDHFISWSRYPNDSIENLVASCRQCNLAKSDRLASRRFVARWVERFLDPRLVAAADSCGWDSNPLGSRSVAANTYGGLVPGAALWDGGQTSQIVSMPDVAFFESMFRED